MKTKFVEFGFAEKNGKCYYGGHNLKKVSKSWPITWDFTSKQQLIKHNSVDLCSNSLIAVAGETKTKQNRLINLIFRIIITCFIK